MKRPFAAFIVSVIIISIIVFLIRQQQLSTNTATKPTPSSPPPTISPTITPHTATAIPSEWQTYTSDLYQISHPPEMKVRQQQAGTTQLVLLGPSQREGTEVYDGILLSIDDGTYQAPDFETFVNREYNEAGNDPASEVSETIEPIIINDATGYTFTVQGLGEFTHIYLPTGEQQFIHISYLMEDPENQGYEKMLSAILHSLTW